MCGVIIGKRKYTVCPFPFFFFFQNAVLHTVNCEPRPRCQLTHSSPLPPQCRRQQQKPQSQGRTPSRTPMYVHRNLFTIFFFIPICRSLPTRRRRRYHGTDRSTSSCAHATRCSLSISSSKSSPRKRRRGSPRPTNANLSTEWGTKAATFHQTSRSSSTSRLAMRRHGPLLIALRAGRTTGNT